MVSRIGKTGGFRRSGFRHGCARFAEAGCAHRGPFQAPFTLPAGFFLS